MFQLGKDIGFSGYSPLCGNDAVSLNGFSKHAQTVRYRASAQRDHDNCSPSLLLRVKVKNSQHQKDVHVKVTKLIQEWIEWHMVLAGTKSCRGGLI